MVLVLWLFNVLFAGVFYVQFSGYLNSVLASSGAASKFLKTFDMNTFFEMLVHNGKELSTILSTALLLIIGYITANIFLNGGILFTLNQPQIKVKKGVWPPFSSRVQANFSDASSASSSTL